MSLSLDDFERRLKRVHPQEAMLEVGRRNLEELVRLAKLGQSLTSQLTTVKGEVEGLTMLSSALATACRRFLNPTDEGPRLETIIRGALKAYDEYTSRALSSPAGECVGSPSWQQLPETEGWWYSERLKQWEEFGSADLVTIHASIDLSSPWYGPIYLPEPPASKGKEEVS